MIKVITCITDQHSIPLVVLAAAVCAFGSFTALSLLARARDGRIGAIDWRWLLASSAVAGASVWSTHFVAMLAYQPSSLQLGYEIGLTRRVTLIGHGTVIFAILLAGLIAGGSWSFGLAPAMPLSLGLLVASALLLDAGAIADQAVGRRAINLLHPEARGRINGLFSGIFLLGGSFGALCAGPAWAWGGWPAVCWVGLAFAVAATVMHLCERRSDVQHQ